MTDIIFTTSGSIGPPKRFSLTEEQLRTRATLRATNKGEVFGSIKSLLCDLRPGSAAAESYRLWAASVPGFVYLTSQGRTPDAMLSLCKDQNIEGIVSTTGGLLNYAFASTVYKFPCVLGSGTPTSPAQSRLIREKLGEQVFYSYGASEVGGIALATAEQVERIYRCVGELTPTVQVTIGEDKLIRAKSTAMATEYIDNPEMTAKYFNDGWFIPGDLGEFRDGLLLVTGRGGP